MRKLTKTMALVSLLTPASVLPLGVGDIKLHSALNQKLNAEISLLLSDKENADDIKVSLAPPDKFDEAGVPWSYFLSKIKFQLVKRSDGSAIIKLSSNEALREPFLDFLLEVTWPNGNLYREFTVLVDPPATYQQPVIPVASPEPVGVNQAEQEFNRITDKPTSISSRQIDYASVSNYGPVGRNETMWSIAEKVKPEASITTEQMVMALYEANPNAFYQNNVNALKAGANLTVPEKEAVLKLSKQQALSAFSKQSQAWRGRVSDVALQTRPVQKTVEDVLDTQLKLLPPSQTEVDQGEKVVAGDKAPEEAETNFTQTSEDQSIGSEEREIASSDLQERLARLEKQLADMQKMLILKDEQIAALQKKQQLEDITGESILEPATSDAKDTSAELVTPEAQPTESQTPRADLTEVKEPVTAAVQPVAKDNKNVAEEKASSKTSSEEVKVSEESKPVKATPPATKVEEETNWLYWILALVGALVLGVFGWLGWKKRQAEEEIDNESMFAASSEISLPSADEEMNVSALDESESYDVGTVGESSFLSEFTPSDFDAFDNEQHEVDPISEADVYLAYGRYQQAEELIKHAIEENSDNNEFKLKLLEIYYANENKEAFENFAEELLNAGKNSDSKFWSKVVEMGSEISPGSPLFSANSIAPQIQPVQDDQDVQELNNEMDFNISTFDDDDSAQVDSGSEEETQLLDPIEQSDLRMDLEDNTTDDQTNNEEPDRSLDFDLGSFAEDVSETITDAEKDEVPSLSGNEIDFDSSAKSEEISELNEVIDSKEEDATELSELKENDDDMDSYDFNFESDENLTEEIQNDGLDLNFSEEEIDLGETEEELKLDDPELSTEDVSFDFEDTSNENSENISEPESEGDFDFDFNFDMDSFSSEGKDGSGENSAFTESEVSDLTDMDEFETKIDLARAYIDMGDSDAAKSIAEEVLEKGSEEQKEAAQAILDELH